MSFQTTSSVKLLVTMFASMCSFIMKLHVIVQATRSVILPSTLKASISRIEMVLHVAV